MTATAFANDPLLDQPLPNPRPQLRLIDSGFTVESANVSPMPAVVVAPAPLHPRQGVEVYRRRRFLAALALTIAIIALSQAFGISLTSFGDLTPEPDVATPAVHVVRPGDTYVGIAAELGVDEPAAFAVQLRAVNGNADLVVGERLVVDLVGLG